MRLINNIIALKIEILKANETSRDVNYERQFLAKELLNLRKLPERSQVKIRDIKKYCEWVVFCKTSEELVNNNQLCEAFGYIYTGNNRKKSDRKAKEEILRCCAELPAYWRQKSGF